ncbi:MAG: HlyD family efflux transporter periplasmic adaptor subunit [Gammaproteobacteria bacterium]|nr:HlyD family efflux transporter periplasmic adaptor subunit [Gammaproteobacteria bacterium]
MNTGSKDAGLQPAPQQSGDALERHKLAGDGAFLDPSRWGRFSEAATAESFAGAWLALQCAHLGVVRRGVVVLGQPAKGPYTPVASWPDEDAGSPNLTAAAELAMSERRGVVRGRKQTPMAKGDLMCVAYPIVVDEVLCGVVAIELEGRDDTELRRVMRQLQWGSGWLEAWVRRRTPTPKDRLVSLIELVAAALDHPRFHEAATAVVTDLAMRAGCDRVSLGFRRGRHTRVKALSHSAQFGKHSNLVRAIGLAMDEALDQYASIVYPAADEGSGLVTRAHAELAEVGGARAICSVPLPEGEKIVGALTLERTQRRPFDSQAVSLLEQAGALLGPLLETRRREDRWLLSKAVESFRYQLGKLVGPRHFAAKLGAAALVGVLVFFFYAEGDFRVTAHATLEGAIQRVAVAPIDGYLAEARARAGDIVQEGDLLVSIDDRDLRLEYLKWSSQKEQVLRKYRHALAQHERSEVNILKAQADQAEAQLELLGEQIARTRVTAPFDGVVVSGDLSQQLGAPVERGQVLLEIAPLNAYRVIVKVNERDISSLAVGQRGQLILSAMPRERLTFSVEKITPVSEAGEGKNTFRVEARLDRVSELLRPGMQGTAKVEVDRRKLSWIWTRNFVNWLRLWVWSWWP